MGDVDIQKIPPIKVREFTGVEPLRIGQIAPAAVHVKELNHIDPISVESLRIDHVRNLDPVRVERFDVTHLPTVDVSVSRFPPMDLSLRRMPPIAVAVQQDFFLPSQYRVHARLLGIEVLRFDIHGRTMISPQDRVRRERAGTHERSFPEVTASGNPGIPTVRTETGAVAHSTHGRGPARPSHPICAGARSAGASAYHAPEPALSVGAPRFSYPVESGPAGGVASDDSVSWGGE